MSAYDDKCVLSDGKYVFNTYDYGRSIGFKLYDQTDTAFNATGYTGYVKIYNSNGAEIVTEISPSWTTQSTGIGTFAFTETNLLSSEGRYLLEVQLEKSGEIRSFRCIHPISVLVSPTGVRTP